MNHSVGSDSEIDSKFAAGAQNIPGRSNSPSLAKFLCIRKEVSHCCGFVDESGVEERLLLCCLGV